MAKAAYELVGIAYKKYEVGGQHLQVILSSISMAGMVKRLKLEATRVNCAN